MSETRSLLQRVRHALVQYWHHRFGLMFVLLLVALVSHPMLVELAERSGHPAFAWAVRLLDGLLAGTILASVAGLVRERVRPFLVLAGLVAVGLRGIGEVVASPPIEALGECGWVVVCLLGIVASARRAFRPGPVDRERIYAALDAYLLAGVAFAAAYWSVDVAWPGSFASAMGSHLTRPKAMYLSFVTLATLGYGDIVPVTGAARGLVVLEALGGQCYIAVLVARLVSLYGRDDGAHDDAQHRG